MQAIVSRVSVIQEREETGSVVRILAYLFSRVTRL